MRQHGGCPEVVDIPGPVHQHGHPRGQVQRPCRHDLDGVGAVPLGVPYAGAAREYRAKLAVIICPPTVPPSPLHPGKVVP